LEITNVDLEEIDPRWTRFSPWDKSWRRNGNTMRLFTSYSSILRRLMIVSKGNTIQYPGAVWNSKKKLLNLRK